jgi:hypothetical protein
MKAPLRKPLTFDLAEMEAEARAPAASPPPEPPAPPPPEPPRAEQTERQQLGVRIDKGVYKRLRTKAIADEVLVQDVVERAVRELLDREGG